MNLWRYQTSRTCEIDAPREVGAIEVVKRLGERALLVRSSFKVAGLTFPWLYVYHYRSPTDYAGIQQRAGCCVDTFGWFIARGNRTRVCIARPSLAPSPGWLESEVFIYFALLSRGGIEQELCWLQELVKEAERSRR